MGKYVYSYATFLNENAEAMSAAASLLNIAAKMIDVEGYSEKDYSSPDQLKGLTDTLYAQIKNEKGEEAAADFMESAMGISQSFIAEESCPTCEEMMEPCDACKAHAEEMKAAEDTESN